MTSLILALVISWGVAARATTLEFITGFRKRPVRIVVSELGQTSPTFVPDSELIFRSFAHIEALSRAIAECEKYGGPCPLRVQVKDWTDLFMLATTLALETDPTWLKARDQSILVSVKKMFEALSTGTGDDAEDLARSAVQPFRTNWLYTSTDAAGLNRIEDNLTLFWEANRILGLVPVPATDQAPKPAPPTADQIKQMLASNNISPHLLKRIKAAVRFATFPPEAQDLVDRMHAACQTALKTNGGPG